MASSPQPVRVRMLRGSYFALLGTIVSVVGNFAISVILARLLGASGLGVYTIYAVLGVVLIPLISLTVPTAVTKFTAESREKDPGRLSILLPSALLILLVAGGFGSLFLVFAIAPAAVSLYGASALGPMLLILGLTLLFNMVSLFSSGVLQGLEEFQTTNLIGAFTVLANVALLVAVLPGFGLVGAAAAAALGVSLNASIATIAALAALRRRGIGWRWAFSWKEAYSLMVFAAPLNAASLVSRTAALVQNSVVALFIGLIDLGHFRVAGVFHSAILFLPRTLLSPMLPILANVAALRTPQRRQAILTQLVKFSILLVLPIAVLVLLGLSAAIRVLYGDEFLPAIPLAVALALVGVTTFPTAILGDHYLVATGRTKAAFWVSLYSAGVGLILMVPLVPTFRTMGLPLAGLVAEASLLAILLYHLERREEIRCRRLASTLAFAAAVLVVAVFLALLPDPIPLLLAAPGTVATFLAEYYRLLNAEERAIFAEGLRKLIPR